MKRWPLLLLFALAACGLDFSSHDPFHPQVRPCEQNPQPNLTGRWSLSGSGIRSGCPSDSPHLGDFVIATAEPLSVQQSALDGGTSMLSLEETPSGFMFNGSVTGSCLEFEMRETLEGDSVRYAFDSTEEVVGRTLSGTFTGTGPSTCRATGEFELRY